MRRRVTLRDALVVTQLALSLVLLVAGSLLARGLLAAREHRPRLGPDAGVVPRVQPPDERVRPRARDGAREARARRPARPAGRPGRRRPSPACRCLPTSTWSRSACAAATRRRTSPTWWTRSTWVPATSRWWACRSSRAAPSARTTSRAGARSSSSTRRWRASTGPAAARWASTSTPTASRRSRTSSSASRATTRSARSARSRGRTCTAPSEPSRGVSLAVRTTLPAARGAADAARRRARAGAGRRLHRRRAGRRHRRHHDRAHPDRGAAAGRVRRAGARCWPRSGCTA